jgi:peptidoglycan/LPS O-acetylase OafA/YrhL
MGSTRYLNGLRGIAAFMVINSHFLQYFLPSMSSGNPDESVLPGKLEVTLYNLPINIFHNGRAAIALFFVLSGFVMTYKFFRDRDDEILVSAAIRRYPRLAVPVFALIVITFILIQFSGFQFANKMALDRPNPSVRLTMWDHQDSIIAMFREGLVDSFFNYKADYTVILWVMTYEFLGSLAAMALAFLAVRIRNRWFIYMFVMAVLLFGSYQYQYYIRFFIGAAIADYFVSFPKIKYRLPLVIPAGVIGIILLTYPRMGLVSGQLSLYGILPLVPVGDQTVFWQTLGATLVIFTILYSQTLQNILNIRPLQFLSRISYSAFIIHLVVIGSFSAWFFQWLKPGLGVPFRYTFTSTYLVTVLLIIGLSYLFTRLVDEPGIRLTKWIYIRFFKPQ